MTGLFQGWPNKSTVPFIVYQGTHIEVLPPPPSIPSRTGLFSPSRGAQKLGLYMRTGVDVVLIVAMV